MGWLSEYNDEKEVLFGRRFTNGSVAFDSQAMSVGWKASCAEPMQSRDAMGTHHCRFKCHLRVCTTKKHKLGAIHAFFSY